jgi:hypothetical protein
MPTVSASSPVCRSGRYTARPFRLFERSKSFRARSEGTSLIDNERFEPVWHCVACPLNDRAVECLSRTFMNKAIMRGKWPMKLDCRLIVPLKAHNSNGLGLSIKPTAKGK